jgi:SAM-dependent methyltransferase
MNRVPLADQVADLVWSTAAAHHSWDLERTFREAARILRPGGRLAFTCEPMPAWPRYLFGRDFGRAERALGINETWIRRATWLRLARRAGLTPAIRLPALSAAAIRERLAERGWPPALARWTLPVLPLLQVSVHLVATRTASR